MVASVYSEARLMVCRYASKSLSYVGSWLVCRVVCREGTASSSSSSSSSTWRIISGIFMLSSERKEMTWYWVPSISSHWAVEQVFLVITLADIARLGVGGLNDLWYYVYIDNLIGLQTQLYYVLQSNTILGKHWWVFYDFEVLLCWSIFYRGQELIPDVEWELVTIGHGSCCHLGRSSRSRCTHLPGSHANA